MDNKINEIRRKISTLRAEMTLIEASIRDQVNRDLDCSEASYRLMAMRAEVAELVEGRRRRRASPHGTRAAQPELRGSRRCEGQGGQGEEARAQSQQRSGVIGPFDQRREP